MTHQPTAVFALAIVLVLCLGLSCTTATTESAHDIAFALVDRGGCPGNDTHYHIEDAEHGTYLRLRRDYHQDKNSSLLDLVYDRKPPRNISIYLHSSGDVSSVFTGHSGRKAIHYSFHENGLIRLITVRDPEEQTKTEWTYDAEGQLIKQTVGPLDDAKG